MIPVSGRNNNNTLRYVTPAVIMIDLVICRGPKKDRPLRQADLVKSRGRATDLPRAR